MKIAIATAVYYPMINGVAVFSHNLACGLAWRGHEVLVICPSLDGKSRVEEEDGVKVARLKSTEIKFYPDQVHPAKKRLFYRHGFRVSAFPQREVARILKDFQPDVVHVQVSDPIGLSVVAFARAHGIPVVTTEHNQPEVLTDPLKMPKVLKKPANALLNAYFMNRQSKSDFVTMPTQKAIVNLVTRAGKDFKVPVVAVSNGVDLSHFRPGRAAPEVYRRYGLDPERPTVLYVGRCDPEKNVEVVIRAFLAAGLDDVQLLIVGDGVDLERLKELAADEPNIHFAGRVVPPELYKVYRLGDVFITASEIETQGIVLVEAAATGLPLVAVDAGAVSEICVDEENGYLCYPGDIDSMAIALRRILDDKELRRQFSKASLELAREHDFERTLDAFIDIYKQVAKKTL